MNHDQGIVYVGNVLVKFDSIIDKDLTSDPSTHVRSRVCVSPLLLFETTIFASLYHIN